MPTWTTYVEPNVTNITGMLSYANTTTSDVFGFILPFVVFIVSYIAMSHHPSSKSLPTSTFITLVLSVLLRVLGIIPDSVVVILIVLLFGEIVFFGKKRIG